jgi:hypothetical protein
MLSLRPVRSLFYGLALLAMPLCAIAAPSRLAVTFSGTEVVISGATPNSRAVLVGLAQEPLGYYSSQRTFCETLNTDSGGIAHFDTKSERLWKSIWGAVDLASGDYFVAQPERSRGRQTEFKGKGLGKGANGKLSKLEQEGQWLELMLVKPGGDVFHALVVDGGPFDEDGTNDGVVHPSVDALELVKGKGEKPDEYRADDVLFVINPDDLSMVVVKVK